MSQPAVATLSFLRLYLALCITVFALACRAPGPSGLAQTAQKPSPEAVTGAPGPPPRLVVQAGHLGSVTALAVDPTGKWLVSGGKDSVVKIWDVATRRELRTLIGHKKEINAVAVAPGGSIVASSSEDDTVRIWDLHSSKLLRTLNPQSSKAFPQSLRSLAFTPDGAHIFGLTDSSTLIGIDAVTGDRTFEASVSGNNFALSPDGEQVLIGKQDGDIELWGISKGAPIKTITTGRKRIFALAFAGAGKLAVSTSEDGVATVWELGDGHEIGPLTGAKREIHAFAVDDAGDRVIAGDWYGTLYSWRLSDRSLLSTVSAKFPNSFTGITSIAIAPGGSTGWFAAGNRQIADWSLDAKEPVAFARTDGYSLAAAFDPKRSRLAVADGSYLHVLDSKTAKLIKSVNLGDTIAAVAYTSGGEKLLALMVSAGLFILDVGTGKTFSASNGAPVGTQLALSADGRRAVTVSAFPTIATVWDIDAGIKQSTFALNGVAAACVALDETGSHMLTAPLDLAGGSLELRDTRNGNVLRTYAPPGAAGTVLPSLCEGIPNCQAAPTVLPSMPGVTSFTDCGFAKNDTRVVAGTVDGKLHVFDNANGAFLSDLDATKSAGAGEAKLGGDTFLRREESGDIRLWRIGDGTLLHTFRGHVGAVGSILPDPAGQFVISTGADRTVRYWAVGEEKPRLTLVPTLTETPGSPTRVGTVVVDRHGYFDFTSRDALSLVHMVRGDDVLGIEQLIDVFYRPALGGAAIAGVAPTKTLDIGDVFRLPPKVGAAVAKRGDRAQVNVDLAIRDGGVSRVAVYRNARVVAETPKDRAFTSTSVSFDVPLVPGPNVFRAVAWSEDAIKGYSTDVTISSSAPVPKERIMHILSVGIDDYNSVKTGTARGGAVALVERGVLRTKVDGKENGAFDRVSNLEFAVADARDVANRLSSAPPPEFAKVEVTRLFDSQASRKNILDAIGAIGRKATVSDIFVLFISGHGYSQPKTTGRVTTSAFYYLPRDYESVTLLERTGISSDDLMAGLSRVDARDIIVLLDTCQSGATGDAFANDVFGALGALGEDSGIQIMASAAASQAALEMARLKHGLFTYTLLGALDCTGGSPLTFNGLATMVKNEMGRLLGAPDVQSAVVVEGGGDPVFARCK